MISSDAAIAARAYARRADRKPTQVGPSPRLTLEAFLRGDIWQVDLTRESEPR